MAENKLYYGNNLDVLRRYVKDESVDLVYLDPPFNSSQDYNVLFAEKDGRKAAAQIMAFEDTWEWNQESARAYHEIVEAGGRVADAMVSFHTFLSGSDMMAYLAMMAPRLVELRRVLKETGTIYLHCDSTAAHYLKMLMDAVFSPQRFMNEITWKRTHSHGNVSRNFGSITDTLLVYTKSEKYQWHQQHTSFTPEYIAKTFKFSDPDGRKWQSVTLRNPGLRPNLHFPFKASNGITYQPHPNGWGCDEDRLKKYDREKRLHFPAKPTGARVANHAKKGADRGIDGRLYFHDDKSGKTKQVILSVKAGENVNVSHVRDLRGVLEREKAEIGVLISMEPPSKPMLKEAADAGFYKSPHVESKFPRIQILTIAQLLMGIEISYPRLLDVTYKQAPKARGKAAVTMSLPLTEDEPLEEEE